MRKLINKLNTFKNTALVHLKNRATSGNRTGFFSKKRIFLMFLMLPLMLGFLLLTNNVIAQYVDTAAPVTTITVTDLAGNPITSPLVSGQQLRIRFYASDDSGTVNAIHTALRSGVYSETDAKNPYSEWEAGYQGFAGTYGERVATVPFYLEYLAEDGSRNLESTHGALFTDDRFAPTTNLTITDIHGNAIAPSSIEYGQRVILHFNATDSGDSGFGVTHTALRENVTSENAAKTPLSAWEAGYQGWSTPSNNRSVTAPFYLEYYSIDKAQNSEQLHSLLVAPQPVPGPHPPLPNTVTLTGQVTDLHGNPLAGRVVNDPNLPEIASCNVGPATTDANGMFSIPNVPIGKYTCLRVLNATQSYECQTIGQSRGAIHCGGGPTVDQPNDFNYNFTVDTTAPVTTVTIKDLNGNTIAPGSVTYGQTVTLHFSGTDIGKGHSVIHTALREGVTSENEAKNPLSSWEAGYQGFASSTAVRTVTAPFYLEYLSEDLAGNIEGANKLLIAPATTGPACRAISCSPVTLAPGCQLTGQVLHACDNTTILSCGYIVCQSVSTPTPAPTVSTPIVNNNNLNNNNTSTNNNANSNANYSNNTNTQGQSQSLNQSNNQTVNR